ncbi:unnamed protein product [Thelazia callipaeda]|uniref:START domain-containing protein n=1 Tax=Thelazia callipaeda TaxID=103827 RepID=A0A0N5CJ32_THECL|nr:unnamed protein product [Thelazia callipaeda]
MDIGNPDRSLSRKFEVGIITKKSQGVQIDDSISRLNSVLSDDDEQEWHDAHENISIMKDVNFAGVPLRYVEKISVETFQSWEDCKAEEMPSGGLPEMSEGCPSILESPPKVVTLPESNPFTPEINHIVIEQLKYARADVQNEIWQLLLEEGSLKMYYRQLEIDGIIHDPIKAIQIVQGVSAREYIHYFFEPRYKHEWDDTLVTAKVVERISMDTVIIHQLHKKVWPAAQRESLFWSNVRYLPHEKSANALDLYLVCNHNCSLPTVPLIHNSNIRVDLTVAMLCETFIKDGEKKNVEKLERSDISCKVCYCAQVSPGGWVPASALRLIYKREYPRFLRGFTKYVIDKVATQPLII